MNADRRLIRYQELREALPELFENHEGWPVTILEDPQEVAEAEAAAAQKLVGAGLPASWAEVGVVYEDPYTITLRDPVRTSQGAGTYVRRINQGNAPGVAILPFCQGRVVLVEHFRHSVRESRLELPRGYGTPGALPVDDAVRELREEIKATPIKPPVPLGVVYPDTGQMATPIHLFFMEIERFRAAGAEEGITAARAVTPDEFAHLIMTEQITDGFTINAYARAMLRGYLPPPEFG